MIGRQFLFASRQPCRFCCLAVRNACQTRILAHMGSMPSRRAIVEDLAQRKKKNTSTTIDFSGFGDAPSSRDWASNAQIGQRVAQAIPSLLPLLNSDVCCSLLQLLVVPLGGEQEEGMAKGWLALMLVANRLAGPGAGEAQRAAAERRGARGAAPTKNQIQVSRTGPWVPWPKGTMAAAAGGLPTSALQD